MPIVKFGQSGDGRMPRKPRDIECVGCGKTFSSIQQNPKFCSVECRSVYIKRCNTVECSWCGQEFVSSPHLINTSERLFCSRECCGKYKSHYLVGENNPFWKSEFVTCEGCGAEFTRKPGEVKRSKHNFCSHECYLKHWDVSNSHQRKRILIKCANCRKEMNVQPCIIKNSDHVCCSKKCKDEYQGKIYSGENHPSWNPEKSYKERQEHRNTPRYQQWRKSVYERDAFRCAVCGSTKGGNFVAHHIESWNNNKDKRLDINNGITLCTDCHREFHHRYGYGNNTEIQFEEYLSTRQDIWKWCIASRNKYTVIQTRQVCQL